MSLLNTKVKAVTLQETLVALLIIGIIASIAIPVLMPMITKAKSLEAKTQLEHVHRLEKNYFYEFSKFTTDLGAIGFEQEILASEDGKANYRIEIVNASPTTYTARATSVVDFDGDGEFNVWEINEKRELVEVIKD